MQKAKLDVEALRTFVTVAQLRSFSAAANQMHRTTSAISYRIKSLEDSVGTPLFQRTTRSVTLTPSGEVLLEKARQIFEWMQVLPEELRQVGAGIEPHFTLVVNDLLYDSEAIASLLGHIAGLFPHAVLEVRRAVYMGVWDELIHNGGHMALGAPGFHSINDDFQTESLGYINWVFVCAPDHPLASEPGPIGNEVLRRYPAVNMQDTSHRLSKRVAWKLSGQKELLVPDLRAKIACPLNGVAVGFRPAPMVRALVGQGRLVSRAVAVGRSASPLSLVWRRQGAGRIADHLKALFLDRDPRILPLLAAIEPAIEG
ncbi:MAG: HTH-type transcriptional activator AllS [Telmatospirillum sp.]|nr:HTH-type transcriptional activator AllS [Telmatospirillum sp.]